MGVDVRTEAEIEREKEEQRAAIRAQIAELRRKIGRLEEYKEQLESKRDDTETGVHTPVSEYDLTVSTDISHWVGHLEEEAEEYRRDIVSGIGDFMSGIDTVIGIIDKIISDLLEEIECLESQLAAI